MLTPWNEARLHIRQALDIVQNTINAPLQIQSLQTLEFHFSQPPNEERKQEIAYELARGLALLERNRVLRDDQRVQLAEHMKKASEALERTVMTPTHQGRDFTAKTSIRLFVSHSSADAGCAATLVDLVRAAMQISPEDIRCTSVPAYKLPAGTPADEALKMEAFESQVFVALLTPSSLKSTYVLFELGARWASGRRLCPVLTNGTVAEALRAPLKALHAINGTDEAEVSELLLLISQELKLPMNKPSTWHAQLKAYVEQASKVDLIA